MYQTQSSHKLFISLSGMLLILSGSIAGLIYLKKNSTPTVSVTDNAEKPKPAQEPTPAPAPEAADKLPTLPSTAAPELELPTPLFPAESSTPRSAETQPEVIPPAAITPRFTDIIEVRHYLLERHLTSMGPKGAYLDETFYEWGSYIDPRDQIQLVKRSGSTLVFRAFNTELTKKF